MTGKMIHPRRAGLRGLALCVLPLALSLGMGRPALAQSADAVVTTIVYQVGSPSVASNLLPVTVSTGSGDGLLTASSTTTYDPVGNVLTVDGPLAGAADTTRYVYDVMRQQTGVIGPDPDGAGALLNRASRTTYDVDGRVILVETGTTTNQTAAAMASFAPLQQAATIYDGVGRKIQDRLLSGGGAIQTLTQYSYDAASRLICTTVRMNPAAVPVSACDPGTSADGDDRITYTEYDLANRVLKVTSGYGPATTGGAFRVEKEVRSYTLNGLEQAVADGKGNTTTYEYDGLDRLAKIRFPNAVCCASSTSDYEQYGYDAAGNRVTWRKRSGETVTSIFDALNRVTYHDGVPTWFLYDNLGRPTWTYAGASGEKMTVLYYDALGRVTYDYAKLNGAVLPMHSWYDLAGRRTRLSWPDTSFYVTYDYDNTGAVTAIRDSAGAALATYAYDDLGRRTAVSMANGTSTQYGYDAASRLSALSLYLADPAKRQTYGFTYNAAGQVKSRIASNALYEWSTPQDPKTYSVNGLNQYTSAAGGVVSHDLRGNMINNGGVGYGYDLDNRLISTSSGATLSYDPRGRLQETAAPNQQTKRLAYDGPNLVTEYDTANNILSRYVPGPGVDEPVVWYEGAGTGDKRFLMRDAQGSIVSVTNAAGVSIATNLYDEYGNPPAVGNTGRFQYTGQIWLPEVGLYHYKTRAYSPSLGRFLQTDPIGYEDGLNWYAYVGNDPVNGSDPTGMCQMLETGGCGSISISSGPLEAPPPTIQLSDGTVATSQATAVPTLPEVDYPGKGLVDWTKGAAEELGGAFLEGGLGPEGTWANGLIKAGVVANEARGAAAAARATGLGAIGERLAQMAGRNRIVVGIGEGRRLHIDVAGRAHGGVPTPHVEEWRRIQIPSGQYAGEFRWQSVGKTRPATATDLLRAYLTIK